MASIPLNQQSKDQLVKTAVKLLKKKTPGREILAQLVQEGVDKNLANAAVAESIQKQKSAGNIIIGFGIVLAFLLTGRTLFIGTQNGGEITTAIMLEVAVDLFISLGCAAAGFITKANAKM